ncbi:hypothetical protein L9F63_013209, partial [Diploptera punctata]
LFGISISWDMVSWPSPVLPKLESENSTLPVPRNLGSWIVSAPSFSAVTAPLIGMMSDKFGRKPMLMFAAVPIITNWIMTLFAIWPEVLIVARTIGGIGSTTIYVVGPMYVGEVVHKSIRGRL